MERQVETRRRLLQLFYSSYSSKSGLMSRERVPVVQYQNGGRPGWGLRSNDDIKFFLKAVRTVQKTQKGNRGKIKRIRKIVIGENVNLGNIMVKVNDLIGNDRMVIGAQLDVNGEHHTWVNPVFNEMREACRQARYAEKNGGSPSTLRFWKRLEKMIKGNIFIDFGVLSQATALLENEISNFEKPFSLAY